MTGYSDRFGGSVLSPSDVAYSRLVMSGVGTDTDWPAYADGTLPVLARLMDIDTTTTTGSSVRLPEATLVSVGQDVVFFNTGPNPFFVLDFAGNILANILSGQQRYIYLTDNTTAAGTWRSILMGVGAASNDAGALAGAGLKAVGATLSQSSLVATVTAGFTLATSDRAKLIVNTGGTFVTVLPTAAVIGDDFFAELRNQGTGVWVILATGGGHVDGSATVALQPGESCFIHSSTTGEWYTVGRGRNQQFNFTQLLLALAGGSRTLSLTEASNVVQTYTGALASAQTLVLPAVVQVYYISNQTTGFPFTVQSPTPGATLSIPSGQNAVVFCDGVNVINASTSIGGISSLLLNAGTVGSPSLAMPVTNNGLFAPSSTSMAVSAGGVEAVRWSAGQTLAPSGTLALPSYSFTAAANSGLYAPSAGAVSIVTGAASRLTVTVAGDVGINTDTPNYLGSLSPTVTIESALQGSREFASSRADATGAGVGQLNWWYKTNSASHNNIAKLIVQTDGVTANQRGGAFVFQVKANAATALVEALRISNSGNVGLGDASTGNILESIRDLNGAVLNVVRNVNAGASATAGLQLESGAGKLVNFYAQGASNYFVMSGQGGIVTKYADFDSHIWRNNAGVTKVTLGATGLVLATGNVVQLADAQNLQWGGTAVAVVGSNAANTLSLVTNSIARLSIDSAGKLTDTTGTELGWKTVPQNSQSAAYTLVLADSGKHLLHPSADVTARIFTIPANASVAFPIGTAVTFVNQNAAGVVTIAITTDTMRLAGVGSTGSRTLAANGIATALKITATEWIISGTGLT